MPMARASESAYSPSHERHPDAQAQHLAPLVGAADGARQLVDVERLRDEGSCRRTECAMANSSRTDASRCWIAPSAAATAASARAISCASAGANRNGGHGSR